MDPKILTAIIVVTAAILVAVAVLLVTRCQKTEHLKQKFGSEYDRVVRQHGDAGFALPLTALSSWRQ